MSPTNKPAAPGTDGASPRRPLLSTVGLLLLALAAGCSLLHTTVSLPARAIRTATGTGKKGAFDPVLLQQRLLRFADDYSGRLEVAIDRLPAATNSVDALARLQLKLSCVESAYAVATGPNELMNLADMFVLVTLARAIVQEQWLPGAYGEAARPMLEACRLGETNITVIALTVVSPQQLNELRAALLRWRQEHPDLRSALFARGLGLEVELAAQRQNPNPTSESLLSLLRLDPLAGLDPAAHELAQARLFGERTLFLAQRKPTLMRWQAELLLLEAAATPPLQEVRTNVTELAASLARLSKTVEEVPTLVRSEREALLQALPAQALALTNLAAQLTATLEAGTQLSESLHTTLQTAHTLPETAAAASARKGESAGAALHPPGLEDYTASARQVELTAQELTELLRTLNQALAPTNVARLSAQVTPLMQQVQTGSRAMADYFFGRAMLLVAVICISGLVTVLLSQWLRKRTNRS